MLGPTYRVTVYNGTGQTIAANSIFVKRIGYNYGQWNLPIFEGSATTICSSGSTLTNTSYLNGTTYTGNTYIGMLLEYTITAPASSSGDVILYLDRSVDGGTTWNDNGLGQVIAVLSFTTSGTKRRDILL